MIGTLVTLFCDGCAVWIHDPADMNARDLRAVAKRRHRWRRMKVDGVMLDLCPKCDPKGPR